MAVGQPGACQQGTSLSPKDTSPSSYPAQQMQDKSPPATWGRGAVQGEAKGFSTLETPYTQDDFPGLTASDPGHTQHSEAQAC